MKAHGIPNTRPASRRRGFSLSEVILVVAILGIMTALAIPIIAQVTSGASDSKARRSAQELASIAASAVAAGDSTIPSASDAKTAIRLLVQGITISDGGLEGLHFGVRPMREKEIAAAARYLRMEHGVLVVDEDAQAP